MIFKNSIPELRQWAARWRRSQDRTPSWDGFEGASIAYMSQLLEQCHQSDLDFLTPFSLDGLEAWIEWIHFKWMKMLGGVSSYGYGPLSGCYINLGRTVDGAVHRRGLCAGISINAASGGIGEIHVGYRCNMVQIPKRSSNGFWIFQRVFCFTSIWSVYKQWRPVAQVLKAFMPLQSVRVLDLCAAPGSKVLGREASIGTVEWCGKRRFTRACNPAGGVTTIIQHDFLKANYAIKLHMFIFSARHKMNCYSQSINGYTVYHLYDFM